MWGFNSGYIKVIKGINSDSDVYLTCFESLLLLLIAC